MVSDSRTRLIECTASFMSMQSIRLSQTESTTIFRKRKPAADCLGRRASRGSPRCYEAGGIDVVTAGGVTAELIAAV